MASRPRWRRRVEPTDEWEQIELLCRWPEQLAGYCLSALAAAGDLPSEAAVRRLVTVTLDGLRPPR